MRWLHRLFMREEPDVEREDAKAAEVDEALAESADVIKEKEKVAEEFRVSEYRRTRAIAAYRRADAKEAADEGEGHG